MNKETWQHYWEIARVEIKSTNKLAQELAYGENENYQKALMLLIERDSTTIAISKKVIEIVFLKGYDTLQHMLNDFIFQKSLDEDEKNCLAK